MKHRYVICAVCLLLAGCQSHRNLSDTDPKALKQQVLNAHHAVIEAAESADADAMFSYILDDEGIILQNGRFYDTRQTAWDDTAAGFRGIRQIDYQFDREIVEILSPDKALLKAAGTSVVQTDDGRQFSTPFCETVLFTLTDDGWKILHAHQSTPAR